MTVNSSRPEVEFWWLEKVFLLWALRFSPPQAPPAPPRGIGLAHQEFFIVAFPPRGSLGRDGVQCSTLPLGVAASLC